MSNTEELTTHSQQQTTNNSHTIIQEPMDVSGINGANTKPSDIDSKLSSLLSASSPSLSPTSSKEASSTESPIDSNQEVDIKMQSPMNDFDYKKIQSELSLYSALTNIYNAAKKIEAQNQKKNNKSVNRRDNSQPAAVVADSEHRHSHYHHSPRDNSTTAKESEKRRRRKSEITDDFQFPVYTGVVFRPKKTPKYNQEQPQQQEQRHHKSRLSQPTPQPTNNNHNVELVSSRSTVVAAAPQQPATTELRTNSIEEIEIKIEKKSKTTVDVGNALTSNLQDNEVDVGLPVRAIEPISSSASGTASSSDHLKNAALHYLLEKSASRIKANELNKQLKSLEQSTISQSAFNLERSFPVHFRTSDTKSRDGHDFSSSSKPASTSAKDRSSKHDYKVSQVIDSIIKPASNLLTTNTSISNIVVTESNPVTRKTPSSLKKTQLDSDSSTSGSENQTPKPKKKLVTFKLPIDQVINYNKPKSSSAYLRSYATGSRSSRDATSRNSLNAYSSTTPASSTPIGHRNSYYGGSTQGYASSYNRQADAKRYSGLFDYTNYYAYQQMSNERDQQHQQQRVMFPYNENGYRNAYSSPNVTQYHRAMYRY